MGTSIAQTATELDELTLLIDQINPNQQTFFFALARGMTKEEASLEAGVSKATVDSWPYQSVHGPEIKRIKEIIRSNPKALEYVYGHQIKMGTLRNLAKELNSQKAPRADVLRLGFEHMQYAENKGGDRRIAVMLSPESIQALAQAAHAKQDRLRVIDLPIEEEGDA